MFSLCGTGLAVAVGPPSSILCVFSPPTPRALRSIDQFLSRKEVHPVMSTGSGRRPTCQKTVAAVVLTPSGSAERIGDLRPDSAGMTSRESTFETKSSRYEITQQEPKEIYETGREGKHLARRWWIICDVWQSAVALSSTKHFRTAEKHGGSP